MVIVIEAADRRKHESLINELYRQRYDHFVVRRNWSLPCKGGMEIDQYDTDDAVYFVYLDKGEMVGSARLNHTGRSSIIADLFPYLIETGEAARGPTLYEGSRFIVSPRAHSAVTSRRIKSELLGALVEYCIEHGGEQFQAIIDAAMLPTFVAMSLKTRVLGLHHEYGGGVRALGGGRCIAFRWDLDAALLADLYAFGHPLVPATASDSSIAVQ